MREIVKISGPFECEFSDGVKVRFDLSYDSRQHPSGMDPLKFDFDVEGPDLEKKKTLKGQCSIELAAYGYGQQDTFKRYMTISAKYGKALELHAGYSHTFKGSSHPSFYPEYVDHLEITDVTRSGYKVKLPPEALHALRLEFSPLPERREVDL